MVGLSEEDMQWIVGFTSGLKKATDVGNWIEVWMAKEARGPGAANKKRTVVKYRVRDVHGKGDEEAAASESLAKVLRKVFVHLKGEEQEGPVPPTNNER